MGSTIVHYNLHIDDFAKTHLTGWSNPTLFQNKPITRRIFVTDSYDKSIDTHYRKSSNKNRKFHTSFISFVLYMPLKSSRYLESK